MRKFAYLLGLLLFIPLSCHHLNQQPGGAVEPNPVEPEQPPVLETLKADPAVVAETVGSLDEFFSRRNRYQGFSGTVLYAVSGEVQYARAFGWSDLRNRDSLHLESSFQLASVSKPITAIATLMLVEQGLVHLDDSLQVYFPEFPYEGITVRMLLNHRSGLPNYMYFTDSVWPDKSVAISNRDVLNLMIQLQPKPYYPPDKRYNYSNTNYALLALMVEQMSKMDFGLFVKTRIFLPLGMHNSHVYNKRTVPENFHEVIGYTSGRRIAENTYLNGVVGDKGVYSSALDLFKLDRALRSGKLISVEMQQLAFEPQHPDLYAWDNYGLGWRIDASSEDNKVVYHTGWWKGFRSYFIRELGADKTLIVLSNTAGNSYIPARELRKLL